MRRKPSRKELLMVIGNLQTIIGRAISADHDRNPNRAAQVNGALAVGHRLCIEARSYEDEVNPKGPWGKLPDFGGEI